MLCHSDYDQNFSPRQAMNPILLLGAAVAFLAFSKRPTQVTASAPQAGQPENPEPLAPTFNNVPLTDKTKTSGVVSPATPQPDATPIVGISPPAEGTKPPYVYDEVPSLATFGASESPLME